MKKKVLDTYYGGNNGSFYGSMWKHTEPGYTKGA